MDVAGSAAQGADATPAVAAEAGPADPQSAEAPGNTTPDTAPSTATAAEAGPADPQSAEAPGNTPDTAPSTAAAAEAGPADPQSAEAPVNTPDTAPSTAAAAEAGTGSTEAEAEQDPLHYTTRPNHFTGELFKVEVGNLPYHSEYSEVAKLLKRHDLPFVRIKKRRGWTRAFITFHNEAERAAAIAKLQTVALRGNSLTAKESAASEDPLVAKRRQQSEESQAKRAKREEVDASLPAWERLADKVTPLWREPYEQQLKHKEAFAEEGLKKLFKQIPERRPQWLVRAKREHGGLPCPLESCRPSPVLESYRNKCEFTVGRDGDGKTTVGFTLGSYSDGIIAVEGPERCCHVSDKAKAAVAAIQAFVEASPLRPYDRVNHTGTFRTLLVRDSTAGDCLVMLVYATGHDVVPDALAAQLKEHLAARQAASGDGPVITTLLLQADDSVSGASADRPSPLVVFGNAVNTQAAEVLQAEIQRLCGLTDAKDTNLLDICCGTGTIGLALAHVCKKVIGIEMCTAAVDDARANAELNGITNTKYYATKVEAVIQEILRSLPKGEPVVGVLDPPRCGLHKKVTIALRKTASLKRLVFVACNIKQAITNIAELCKPVSKQFTGTPFRLESAVPVDLFPQTGHCEVVMLLTR